MGNERASAIADADAFEPIWASEHPEGVSHAAAGAAFSHLVDRVERSSGSRATNSLPTKPGHLLVRLARANHSANLLG